MNNSEAVNFQGKAPRYEGERVIYTSPHHPDVILTDRAEYNIYGQLVWVAAKSIR